MGHASERRWEIEQEATRAIGRLISGIELLLLVLGLMSLGFEGLNAVDRTAISAGLFFYGAYVVGSRYLRWRGRRLRRLVVLEIWAMVPFVSWSVWFTDRLASPLLNAYLLVVVAGALALGLRHTSALLAVIGACYLAIGELPTLDGLASFAYLGGLVAQLAPLIVVGYVAASYSADIRYGMNRARLRSEIDPLTGLYSLHGFALAVDRFFAHAARHGSPISLLVLDIDNLQAVADAEGRGTGDRVVRHVASCIERELRHSDLAARLGDDEFVALLPDASPEGALDVAERIRVAASTPIDVEGRTIASSVSVGVGSYAEDGRTVDDVLHRAERAMQQAKEQGRNRVARLAL